MDPYRLHHPSWARTDKYTDQNWHTVLGHDHNSARLAHALIAEGERVGGWGYGITINSPKGTALEAFKAGLTHICDRLIKHKFPAFLFIELSRSGRWHLHGVSPRTINEFRAEWDRIRPPGWTMRITARLTSWRKWCRYSVKCKEYRDRRVYLHQNLGLRRHRATGGFWTLTVAEYWELKKKSEEKRTQDITAVYPAYKAVRELTGWSDKYLRYRVDWSDPAYKKWSDDERRQRDRGDTGSGPGRGAVTDLCHLREPGPEHAGGNRVEQVSRLRGGREEGESSGGETGTEHALELSEVRPIGPGTSTVDTRRGLRDPGGVGMLLLRTRGGLRRGGRRDPEPETGPDQMAPDRHAPGGRGDVLTGIKIDNIKLDSG